MLSQETEARLLAGCLAHVRRSFVDVGAERGAWTRFLVSQGLHGVCFEPLPKHKGALADLDKAGAVRSYEFAIDQEDRQAEFHVACDAAGQPLDYFHSLQRLDSDSRVQHQQKVPVTCRSLASLSAEGLIEPALGVLKIDTEGNDLRVLRGLGPVRADIILCEFFTKGLYNGWSEAEPTGLIAEAQKLGYSWWLAVRRRAAAELVSLCPVEFTQREWGNLLFLTDQVFHAARQHIGHFVAEAENQLFNSLEQIGTPKRRRWL